MIESMSNTFQADACVLFGATGDLAFKQIFPALQAMTRRGHLEMPVIIVARSGWSIEQLKGRMKESLEQHGGVDANAFAKLTSRLQYVDGNYSDETTYARLRQVLADAKHPLHYLAIPPSMFETVARGLAQSGCADGARIIVEKPFGRDLASAQSLDSTLHSFFPESAIWRIDHFLGKEPVQNLLYFRFANSFLEPIWNSNHIASIQITLAESFGVEGRGRFYEAARPRSRSHRPGHGRALEALCDGGRQRHRQGAAGRSARRVRSLERRRDPEGAVITEAALHRHSRVSGNPELRTICISGPPLSRG